MGGAGHMLHAIKSLKANRALLKNKRSKNRGSSIADSNTQIEFKKVKPEELDRIKAEIRKEAQKSKQKELILGVIIFIGLITLFVWLMN